MSKCSLCGSRRSCNNTDLCEVCSKVKRIRELNEIVTRDTRELAKLRVENLKLKKLVRDLNEEVRELEIYIESQYGDDF